MRNAIDDLEAMGEKQLETFVYGRLVVRYQFHKKITLNKMEIWNHTVTGQLEWIVEFSPSKSALKKMNSGCQHRKTIAEKLFEHDTNNTPQSLCKDGKNGIELYHDLKAEITKWFNSPTFVILPYDQEGKPVVVVEMPPLIRAKAFVTHAGSLINFDQCGVLVYETCIELQQDRFGL